jgi:hypothetical protein
MTNLSTKLQRALSTTTSSVPRARWLLRVIPGLVGAAALATTLVGTGCYVEPGPIGSVGVVYVTHAHVHGPDCGHYRVWNDDNWVYYYDGRWEYYTPGYHRWVYYSPGYVPVALRADVSAAKSYRPHAVTGYSKGSVDLPGATKASPPAYGHVDTGPAYAPSKRADDDAPRATPAPGFSASKATPSGEGRPAYGPGPSGGSDRSKGAGATKAPPPKGATKK